MTKKIAALAATVVAIALALSACAITGDGVTDPSFQTLRYQGGFAQGSKFKACVQPGSKMASDDTYYPYPTTQREDVWDTQNFNRGSKSADHKDLELTDKDGNIVYVKLKISFFLNTSCDKVTVKTASGTKTYKGGVLQAFHEMIGKTRKSYFDADKGTYGSGWLWAMDNYISAPAVSFLTPEARTRTAEQMWKDPSVAKDLQARLAAQLPDLVNGVMETDLQFYKDFTVQIISMTPSQEYLDLYKQRQNAQIAAETANLNKQAQVTKAEADAAVARAQSKIKAAEIAGYPSITAYLQAQAIAQGMNPFQPVIVAGTPAATK